MTSRTDIMAMVALVVAVVALIIAMYTQFTVKKALDETVRRLSWNWNEMASGLWTKLTQLWMAIPQQQRDKITSRVNAAYNDGMAQLETADPIALIGRVYP